MLVVGVKRGDFLLIKRLRISIAQPAHKGYSENVKGVHSNVCRQ